MFTEQTRRFTISFYVFVMLLSAGCGASSEYMLPVKSPKQLVPPPGSALIVFLRPSSYGSSIRFRLIDGHGKFLGDLLPEVHFAVPMKPGTHMLFAWSENVTPLQATVEADKIYFVVARPYMGWWKARVNLTALTQRSEDWPKLGEWLSDSERNEVDYRAGQAFLDARKDDVAAKIATGLEAWNELSPEERAKHILLAEDGITARSGKM